MQRGTILCGTITVPDLDAAIAAWRDVLGLELCETGSVDAARSTTTVIDATEESTPPALASTATSVTPTTPSENGSAETAPAMSDAA